jgi:hypothetical protein
MDEASQSKPPSRPLRDAVRAARIEAAERSGVIVELRDAEVARLSMLNDALDPMFSDIPPEHLDLFDRGLSAGTQPRLWIDMVTHVAMGRDKRSYRLLQDTQNGRRVLEDSPDIQPIVTAITRYVARRLVAREQLLSSISSERQSTAVAAWNAAASALKQRARDPAFMFVAGIGLGILAILGAIALR